jgi:hypothetical protein
VIREGSKEWETVRNPDGELTLLFSEDGELVRLHARPGIGWTPEELIKVAESLETQG